jgi:hypothetical protein
MGKTPAFLSPWHPPCRRRGITTERAADGQALEPVSLSGLTSILLTYSF